MYYDKDKQLKNLNERYEKGDYQCVRLYSRPGMGKTELLKRFSQGRMTLWFRPLPVSTSICFQLLKTEMLRLFGEDEELAGASRYFELFRYLKKFAAEKQLLFIVEDYPQWTGKNRALSTLFQNYVKKEWTNSRLFLILCKSCDFSQKETIPAHDTVIMRALNFFEMRRLYPSWNQEEQIYLYGITGGMPGYLRLFPKDCVFKERLYELFFTHNSLFENLFAYLPHMKTYTPVQIHTLLLTLGDGQRKLHEISESTGLTPSAAALLLHALESEGLVQKLVPVTEPETSRRALYRISDGICRFWYTFSAYSIGAIQRDGAKELWNDQVLPRLDAYFRSTFEEICMQFLRLLPEMSQSPFTYQETGCWWGQHPTKKRTEYVPIAAANKNNVLLGACFWTDEWVDTNALSSLEKHAGLFAGCTLWYFLFAKADFAAGMNTLYGNTVRLYTLKDMCRITDTCCNLELLS